MFACLHAPGNLPILLDCARQFSPILEITSDHTVTLDIRGLDRLYGSVERIAHEMQLRIGIPANLAIASNPDTAIYAAQGYSGVTVIPRGAEGAKLAPLAVNLLQAPPEIGALFDRWGVHTFGQLAKLPSLGIAARLGEAGVYLQKLAQGVVHRQLRVLEEPRIFEKTLDLEHPIDSLESLLFVLSNMVQELCLELQAASLATNEMHLRLALDKHSPHWTAIRLPVPTLDKSSLLKLLQLNLDRNRPTAAIVNVCLRLEGVPPRTLQSDLFRPAFPSPEKLEITIARIRYCVGEGNVGTPRMLDTHRPDSFVMEAFTPPAAPAAPEATPAIRLMLRRFRPPQQATVKTVRERPIHIVSPAARGDIVIAKGPWLTSGNWWRHDSWDRREWDIAIRTGGIYRIFEDQLAACWFVDGNYD
jgi:protein ImuB